MEKKMLNLNNVEDAFETVYFQEQAIKVKKRLSLDDIVNLVTNYIRTYFSEDKYESAVIYAEYGLKSELFDVATNFEIKQEDFSVFISTDILENVISKISNYNEVELLIDKTIKKIEKEKSMDGRLGVLVEKAISFVDKIASTEYNIDEKTIKTITDAMTELKNTGLVQDMALNNLSGASDETK